MPFRSAASLVLLALSAPLACRSEGPIAPTGLEHPLQTDRLVYTLSGGDVGGWETTLIVRYENRRGATVYLPGCVPGPVRPQYGFVRPAPNMSRIIFSLAWACVGGVPALAIPDGGARVDTVHFVSLFSPAASPPDTPEGRVGLMRVSYELYSGVTESGEADWRTLLPESERLSNVFEIRYPE
jgi:hypothetical protein